MRLYSWLTNKKVIKPQNVFAKQHNTVWWPTAKLTHDNVNATRDHREHNTSFKTNRNTANN